MDDYLTLIAALLGAIIGGIIGFASAYLIQRQRFKRENVIEMRDKIYGQIFMEMSKILETVRLFGHYDYSSIERLKQVTNNYLFRSSVKQDLKSKLAELLDRIEVYNRIRIAAELVFEDIIREEVKKAHKVDIGNDANAVLALRIGKIQASAISLKEAVFLRYVPEDFVAKEKEKWGKDTVIEVRIGNNAVKSNYLKHFESLYSHVIMRMQKENLYVQEKIQRDRLIQELENMLEDIRKFVTLSQ